MGGADRRGCLTDATDEEWSFVLPYLLLSREGNRSRVYALRAGFNAVRYVVKGGNQWRLMPNDLAPWRVAYQQMRRWVEAGAFERLVAGVRSLLREPGGGKGQPAAVCIDSRTSQSTPESGARAGYGGAKRRKGSKVHIAVDPLGHLLALKVTAASEGDREQAAALAEKVQQVTGNTVEIAYVDQGYTGPNAAQAAEQRASNSASSNIPWPNEVLSCYPNAGPSREASPGPRASEDSRRPHERLDTSLKGFHCIAFACIMIARFMAPIAQR